MTNQRIAEMAYRHTDSHSAVPINEQEDAAYAVELAFGVTIQPQAMNAMAGSWIVYVDDETARRTAGRNGVTIEVPEDGGHYLLSVIGFEDGRSHGRIN